MALSRLFRHGIGKEPCRGVHHGACRGDECQKEDRSHKDEPIQKVIPDDMALPIPYCMGSKVQIQCFARRDSPRGREPYPAFSQQMKCEIVELNVRIDHVHLLIMIPPKVSISDYMGMLKGRTAIRILNRFKKL